MTGAIDYLSDGERVIAVENGHPFLGQVTGVRYYPNKKIHYGVSRTDKNLNRLDVPLDLSRAVSSRLIVLTDC